MPRATGKGAGCRPFDVVIWFLALSHAEGAAPERTKRKFGALVRHFYVCGGTLSNRRGLLARPRAACPARELLAGRTASWKV
jgi:hypothetical protein